MFCSSVKQLQQTLGCYDSYVDDLYLGERYGYRLLSPDGFNYITGGGGIVFSVTTIHKLLNQCSCPTSSAPDDMIIAICLKQLGIEPIHSSLFHQVLYCNCCWLNEAIKNCANFRLGQPTTQKNYSPIHQYLSINFGKSIPMRFIANGFAIGVKKQIVVTRLLVERGKT